MTTASADLFQVFVDAKEALEQLPAAREELAKAMVDLDNEREANYSLENKNHFLNEALSVLKAELAAKEAALAHATFQHQSAQSALHSLRSILDVAIPVPGPSDREVVRAVDVREESGPKESTGTTQKEATGSLSDSTMESPTEPQAAPTPEPVSSPKEPTSVVSTTEALPVPSAPSSENAQGESIETTSLNTPTSADTIANEPGQSESNPTASLMAGEHSDAQSYGVENLGSATQGYTQENDYKPYRGWSHWTKPDYVSFEEFHALGGELPPNMREAS
jgi:hypothetical protein